MKLQYTYESFDRPKKILKIFALMIGFCFVFEFAGTQIIRRTGVKEMVNLKPLVPWLIFMAIILLIYVLIDIWCINRDKNIKKHGQKYSGRISSVTYGVEDIGVGKWPAGVGIIGQWIFKIFGLRNYANMDVEVNNNKYAIGNIKLNNDFRLLADNSFHEILPIEVYIYNDKIYVDLQTIKE